MENYVVIDLEMTGLHPKNDAVLEVGAVKIRGKEAVDTLGFFVNAGRVLDEKVTELTGITQQMADSGISPAEAIRRVTEFTEGEILVGHNVIFDYSFLKQLAVNERIPFERQAVDTLKLARKFLTLPEKKNLDSLCEYYGIEREKKHRALEDALATWKLYERIEREFGRTDEKAFVPKPLQYKPKRQTPATPAQKKLLKELADYHKIDMDFDLEALTRSEASRMADKIMAKHGRMPRPERGKTYPKQEA